MHDAGADEPDIFINDADTAADPVPSVANVRYILLKLVAPVPPSALDINPLLLHIRIPGPRFKPSLLGAHRRSVGTGPAEPPCCVWFSFCRRINPIFVP